MFSHIMIGSNDIEKSKIFYDNVLGVLGAKEGVFMPNLTGQTRYFYFLDKNTFVLLSQLMEMKLIPEMETQWLLMFLTKKLETNGTQLDSNMAVFLLRIIQA